MRNQLKSGVILSYIISVIQVVVQLFYTPIVLRLLGQSEYGLYTLVNSVISCLSLCGLGFSGSYLRFYSRFHAKKDEDKIAELNGMFLIIYIGIAAFSSFLGSIFVANVQAILGANIASEELVTAKVLMVILIINFAISFINTIFDSIIIAHELYLFQRIVRLFSVVFNPLIALPFLLMGYKSVVLVSVTTILSFFNLIIDSYYVVIKMKSKFVLKKFDELLLKEIGSFSFFIFINMIIDQLNWNVDKFIIGRYCGTDAVAVYGVGSQLNNIDINVSLSVSSVFAPRINRMQASGASDEHFTNLFIKTGRIQFIIMALLDLGLLFFGKSFISLWAGERYTESYYVMLCLVMPALIACIENVGLEIQRSKNKHQFRSVVYLLMSIVNVCISISLTKSYGPVGAAVGTTIGLIVGNGFIMNWYYQKGLGIDIKAFWKSILHFVPSLFIPIVLGMLINRYIQINTWFSLICTVAIYIMVYCICMWMWGMNTYEKDIVKGILRISE